MGNLHEFVPKPKAENPGISGKIFHKEPVREAPTTIGGPELARFFAGDTGMMEAFDVMMNGAGLAYLDTDMAALPPADRSDVIGCVREYKEATEKHDILRTTAEKKKLKTIWQKNFG